MIVSIEGNIGAGKSTLLGLLKNKYVVIEEDVESWKKEGWLDLFYSDMQRYSGTFQLRTQISHIENGRKIVPHQINIVERSPLSNKFIFGSTLLQDGLLHQLEYNIIDQVNTLIGWEPNVLIVLLCDPKVCLERIIKRARPGENIPLSYLESLHQKHLDLQTHASSKCTTYSIDTTYLTPDQVYQNVKEILDGLEPKSNSCFSDMNYLI